MNAYSCKPSDHQSDAGMHTLMCIAILISGICSDESFIVYDRNRRTSRGNGLVWDSMTSVRAAVLTPQVSITFLRAQGTQVWVIVHFSKSSLVEAIASGVTVWENNKCCAASIESVLCTLYILQTNVSEDFAGSAVSSSMPKFFRKPWCSLKIFLDDHFV